MKRCSLLSLLVAVALQLPGVSGAQTTPAPLDEEAAARKCQENLAKIDGSKEQLALEFRLRNNAPVTWQNVLDPIGTGKLGQGYLKKKPTCPSGGTYTLNNVGTDPLCSIGMSKGERRYHTLDGKPPSPPVKQTTSATSSTAAK